MQLHSLSLMAAAIYAESTPTTRGMLFACWAIVVVLLAMALVFLRSGKKEYAVAILPLLVTPFVHIFSGNLASLMDAPLPFSATELRVMIDLTAGLVSCLLLGAASRGLKGRRTRYAFFVSCAVFVMILTLVLVTNTLVTARV